MTYTSSTWQDGVARGMCRGPDRLALTLLNHPSIGRVLVVNPFRSKLGRVGRRVFSRPDARFPVTDSAELVQPLRLRRHDPRHLSKIVSEYTAYDRQVEAAAARAGMSSPVVIAMNPLVAGFCPFRWTGPVTYYANDDWAAYPGYRRSHAAILAAYAEVNERGRRLCAVSQAIIDRIRPTGYHALVPNGIEPREWLDDVPAPRWFDSLPRPRGLYVGTIDSRLDVESLRSAAQTLRRLGGSLILVGPTGDLPPYETIEGASIVHVSRTLPRREVIGIVRAADVGLLPHVRDPLTEAMSPLKLYEYLAGGRPVVATNLPPAREVDDRVLLVDDPLDFGDTLEAALRLKSLDEHGRRAFVAANSWRVRHDQILEIALA